MNYILETHELTKTYSGREVVSHVNMHVEKGSIYGFIGKNGAGKTSLMKMVCGLTRPTSGEYTLFNEKDADQGRKKIGSMIENPPLYPNLTVKENLIYYSKLKNATSAKAEELLTLVGLDASAANKRAGNLSLGMKQRLSIAIALLNDPELLILDEPINGLDPEGIVEIRHLLVKLNRERGITILISSHILGELEKMVTHYGIIKDGRLIREFPASALEQASMTNPPAAGANPTAGAHPAAGDHPTAGDHPAAAAPQSAAYHPSAPAAPSSGRLMIQADDAEKALKLLQENGIKAELIREQHEDIEGLFMSLLSEGQ